MSESKAKFPPGIGYIVGNEAAERFSYYGMRAILVIFMTQYLMDSSGSPDFMTDAKAREWYHTFSGFVYFFPIIGALISDIFWGKYKTIITLSVVYCLGHLCLAFMDLAVTTAILEPRTWLAIGLGLIAVGSGGIKPCVSAHVGDQFTSKNASLIEKAFSLFYFSINFGSFFSYLLIPYFLHNYGPALAFGTPGILMFIATIVFYMGRKKFIAIPAAGIEAYKNDLFSKKGLKALGGLSVIYLFVAMFWALYDQTGSAWVLQADKMDRMVNIPFYGQMELLPSQIQFINPLLIMLYIPIFSLLIYPFFGKFFEVTPLRKIGTGFFITAISFAICAVAEQQIQAGLRPSFWYQMVAYFVITAGEVLISITALEFSYTQAPNTMKSFIMGCFLLSVSLGNFFTAAINGFIDSGSIDLGGASYYWFFTGLIIVTGVIFIFVSKFYKEEKFIQEGVIEEELHAGTH